MTAVVAKLSAEECSHNIPQSVMLTLLFQKVANDALKLYLNMAVVAARRLPMKF
jgi:hypothetical protein